jgi:hypothetical protein
VKERRALYAAIAFLLAAPFFLFDWVPLYDLPNHIAQQHILFGDGAPGAATYYAVHWRPIPNLALEGAVFMLHRIMPVDLAVRVFLAVTALQLFLGTIALRRAVFGRGGGLEIAAALFVFNGPLLFGFVNECFGVGMALWAFALWLSLRARHALAPGFALLASLILFAHLFAFAIYALMIASFCVGEVAHRRCGLGTAAAQAAHLALPLALFAMAPGGAWTAPVFDVGRDKIAALGWALGGLDPAVDAAFIAAVLLGLLAVVRRVVVAPSMVAPLVALAVAFLVLPRQLGDATFVDYRIPPVLMLVLSASLAWRAEEETWRRPTDIVIASIFAARLVALMAQWWSWQPEYAQIRAAFELLPQGARLFPLGVGTAIIAASDRPPLGHVAALAVTLRGALIPTLFVGGPHDLLSYRDPWAAHVGDPGVYQYFLLIRPERIDQMALPAHETIARGDNFILARAVR